MNSTGSAAARRWWPLYPVCMKPEQLSIRRVTDPNDPAIQDFGALQNQIYFEPEMLIPAGYIAQILADAGGARQNVLLLAEQGGTLRGGTLFHYLPEAGAGFSSFLGVAREARGQGVARALHDARWQTLTQLSRGQCRALLIDVVNPARESVQQQQQEQRAGSDALQRRQRFHALGFRTVDLVYQQPVGGDHGGPVTDMDLLAYLPGTPPTISAALVGATMRAYWTPWLGRQLANEAAELLMAGQEEAALLPAWEGPVVPDFRT